MNANSKICAVCESNSLEEKVYSDEIERAGSQIIVSDLEISVCAVCKQEQMLPDQIRRNEQRFADAERRFLGLLSGTQIREVRNQLGLSQKQASEIFGGGRHAFSKYERGQVVQSVPMDRLLRLASDWPMTVSFLSMYSGTKHSPYRDRPKYMPDNVAKLVRPKTHALTPKKAEPIKRDESDWHEVA